jgi:hypothetical protein
MQTLAIRETVDGRTQYARAVPQRPPVAITAEASWCAPKRGADEPLMRVAALLVSISRNNSYEGRDPALVPDTLTSGFVADLLGLDIDALATLLVELQRQGLIESNQAATLRLKDIAGLERLAA